MRWPDAIDGTITLEWIVKGKVGIFRSHLKPFSGPAPINGACVVEVYSATSYEIKALVATMGNDLMRGYRTLVRIMEKEGFTGPRIERFDMEGNASVIIDGKRQIAQKTD